MTESLHSHSVSEVKGDVNGHAEAKARVFRGDQFCNGEEIGEDAKQSTWLSFSLDHGLG